MSRSRKVSRFFGLGTVGSGLLVALQGCTPGESLIFALLVLFGLSGTPAVTSDLQGAVNEADAGATVKVGAATFDEDVTVDKEGVTIVGNGSSSVINGEVVVTANNVTLSNLTIAGNLDTLPGSFEDLTLDNVEVQGWGATVSGTFTCSDIVQPGETIQTAIDNATAGDSVCVASSTYNENLSIGKNLGLFGMGFPAISASGGTAITISSDNVTVNGLEIANPTGSVGIFAQDHSHITIQDNKLHDIGDGTPNQSAQAIYIKSLSAAVDDIHISGNTISKVLAGPWVSGSGPSAKGIFIGDSTGAFNITNLIIEDNTISSIDANTSPWKVGRGAYGILLNHGSAGGQTVGAQILNNTIDDLEGLWAHAIGLEADTPNAVVQGNKISNLVDHKAPSDAIGVFFESNPSADSVSVDSNNFSAMGWGVAQHPDLVSSHNLIVDARNNWWGTTSGPGDNGLGPISDPVTAEPADGTGVGVGPNVRFDPWATTPF